jgi:predicted enzyme related to lactoylglutathione lyase
MPPASGLAGWPCDGDSQHASMARNNPALQGVALVDELSGLFSAYDRGTLSRRHLLQALGIAAVSSVPLARALAQGQCAGRAADSTAACNKTPFKAPFDATGWKTVLLDHFSMQVTDPEREAAFYAALMNWKVRSNDGKEIYMDIGDWGAVKIRGGYVPRAGGRGGGGRAGGGGGGGGRGAGGDTNAVARGRGAGGGGGGGGAANPSNMPPCTTPRTARIADSGVVWDGFCWGIAPWDTNKVEAALKARGLNPVADHSGNDFRSFHVKDPDGLDVQISNGNKSNRRRTPANGKLNVPLPFEPTNWKTLYLDHISFSCTSYKETVAFYEALLGWRGLGDEGSQNETEISPEIGGLLIRGGNATAPNFQMPPVRNATMNHISFGISPFDPDVVNAELCKRGLSARVDTGSIASSPDREKDIHTASYKSYHTQTPNGYDLQISAKIAPDK